VADARRKKGLFALSMCSREDEAVQAFWNRFVIESTFGDNVVNKPDVWFIVASESAGGRPLTGRATSVRPTRTRSIRQHVRRLKTLDEQIGRFLSGQSHKDIDIADILAAVARSELGIVCTTSIPEVLDAISSAFAYGDTDVLWRDRGPLLYVLLAYRPK
jgi:hypothetical protein